MCNLTSTVTVYTGHSCSFTYQFMCPYKLAAFIPISGWRGRKVIHLCTTWWVALGTSMLMCEISVAVNYTDWDLHESVLLLMHPARVGTFPLYQWLLPEVLKRTSPNIPCHGFLSS